MGDKKVLNRELYDYMFKILLLGDAGVGKTSLMWRFSEDVFKRTYISTIGIDFKLRTIEMEGKRVRLQIWDTAGQERFHAISVSYYRSAMGIVLVYDITRRHSFENISKWLRNINEHAKDDVVKLLVGNKSDLEENARAVKREEGEQLAEEYDMNFFETSAMENNCIEEAFQRIAKDIMEKIVEEWGKKKHDEPARKALDELSRTKIKSKAHSNCC
ncbi:ras-related protein Rab-10-like [Montipora capricornis]|uniref:ras-related protein Rab-10-like n=1 Tax=Montipora foliosa TaxID=591990 RepID=UPI0035F1196C